MFPSILDMKNASKIKKKKYIKNRTKKSIKQFNIFS